jgi:endonuclease/exonuclease/phosphatase family metal-dependent hydrolase
MKAVILFLCVAFCNGADVSLLSFNVYFNDDLARYEKLIKWSFDQKSDVILFQECTPRFKDIIEKSKPNDFVMTDTSISDGYGQITVSRFKIMNSSVLDLPTRMGRKALFTTIVVTDKFILNVVNVHLESLNNAGFRRQQLDKIRGTFASGKFLLAGDFNFSKSDVGNDSLTGLFEMKYTDPEMTTYDPINNPLARTTADADEIPTRIDRCVTNDDAISGTASVIKVDLSDHYPVLFKFQVPTEP